MQRFVGYPVEDGLMVLDTATGRVVWASRNGSTREICPAQTEMAPALERARAVPKPAASSSTNEPAIASRRPSVGAMAGRPGRSLAPLVGTMMRSKGITSAVREAIAQRLNPGKPAAKRVDTATAADDLGDLTTFERRIVDAFPTPLAAEYAGYLKSDQPVVRCRRLADVVRNLISLWGLTVSSQLILHRELPATRLAEVSAQKNLRASQRWYRLLKAGLKTLEEGGVYPFCPEIGVCLSQLETRRIQLTENADAVSVLSALLKFADDVATATDLRPNDASDLLDRYQGLVLDQLEAAQFVTNYPLFCRGDGELRRLMGMRPTIVDEPVEAGDANHRDDGWTMLNEPTDETLSLVAINKAGAPWRMVS